MNHGNNGRQFAGEAMAGSALGGAAYGAGQMVNQARQISRTEQATSALEKAIYDAYDALATLESRLHPVLASQPPTPTTGESGAVPTPSSVAAQIETLTQRVALLASKARGIESRLEV